MKKIPSPQRKTWLWWLALLIIAIGGGICYLLSGDQTNSTYRIARILTVAITIISAGICIISATANWWIKH
jgi:CHASE2 domain-containing sensor protein